MSGDCRGSFDTVTHATNSVPSIVGCTHVELCIL